MRNFDTKILKKSPRGTWAIIETANANPSNIDLYHSCKHYATARRGMVATRTLDSIRIEGWSLESLKKKPWSSWMTAADWVSVKLTKQKHRYKCSFCGAYAPPKLATALKLFKRV